MSGLVLMLLAQPFVRTMTGTQEDAACLWWEGPAIEFRQNSAGNPATGAAASLGAVSSAFINWNDAMKCSLLYLTEGAKVPTRRVGAVTSGANVNLVLFRTRTCSKVVPAGNPCWAANACGNSYDCWDQSSALLGTTTVSYDATTGRIFDADIEFNAADHTFTVVDAPVCTDGAISQRCVATDIQNTATHEIGHFLGLGHTTAHNSTMNVTSTMGERSKRNLDEGTRSFLCAAYPPDTGPDDCVIRPVTETLGTAANKGCSTTSLAPLAGLALLTLVRRRRLAVLAVLAATSAQATTVLSLELDSLIDSSDAIARVRVERVQAQWTGDGARIVTEATLSVLDGWKGGVKQTMTVFLPGGVVGRVGQRIDGVPRLEPGTELIVFLEARGDRFVLTGLSQGVFDVTGTTAKQRSLEARYVDPRTGAALEKKPLSLELDALKRRVLERLPTQGADSNRALPFALPTQMSR